MSAATIADTTAGKVQGLEKQGVLQFRGVPYARADRFRPPRPVEPWAGVRSATSFAPRAPQNASPLEAVLGSRDEPSSEDCLALNVYTPALDDAARPVMVWIHGGAFTAGAGNIPWYDASNLVRMGDVVVVTFNYRLGMLGFLPLGQLDAELAGSVNNGIRDQIAALGWVRDNIAGFGGNPGNVTVFGESAGAMSLGMLLAAPEAAGLFHRAIAQSGAASQLHTPETAEWVTERCLTELGLSPATADRLFDLPVEDILRAQGTVYLEVFQGRGPGPMGAGGQLPFRPMVDGRLLPRPPLASVAAGNAAGVPLVAGTTAEEWNLFHLPVRQTGGSDEAKARRRLARLVGADRVDDLVDAYRTARGGLDPDGLVCAVMTDRVFRIPAIRLAEAQQPHAPRVSMYRFGYRSTAFNGALGACHAIDVPFVFDNLDRRGVGMFLGSIGDDARRLAHRCARAWLAVAGTGSPEHDDLPWPAYDLDRRATCELDRTTAVSHDPDGELRALWDELDPPALTLAGPAPAQTATPS
jgi:para-nitrobenzyl esterase